jgi:hypothetical protein
VAPLRWTDLDGDVWEIPEARAKNKLSHRVPPAGARPGDPQHTPAGRRVRLSEPAKKRPDPRRRPESRGANEPSGAWLRGRRGVHSPRLATLRGLPDGRGCRVAMTISRLLNHRDHHQTTRVYERHTYDLEKRQALQKWVGTLTMILEQKDSAKVVPERPSPVESTAIGGGLPVGVSRAGVRVGHRRSVCHRCEDPPPIRPEDFLVRQQPRGMMLRQPPDSLPSQRAQRGNPHREPRTPKTAKGLQERTCNPLIFLVSRGGLEPPTH